MSRPPLKEREFDAYASAYADLLRDPLREYFSSQDRDLFHKRKRDFLVRRFRRKEIQTASWSYLDVGCGRGELLRLLGGQFAEARGCDPSAAMLRQAPDARLVQQEEALQLPFEDSSFDLVTAVCVFHHLAGPDRPAMIREIRRVLKPGGTFCMIEHNPWNPLTRVIVSRSPVDVGAQLLSYREANWLLRGGELRVDDTSFFLYLPERLYRLCPALEDSLRRLPLGGQYAAFGVR